MTIDNIPYRRSNFKADIATETATRYADLVIFHNISIFHMGLMLPE